MRSLFAVLRRLVIPAGALPSQPQISLESGSTLPAELVAYYAAFSFTVVAAVIYRADSNDYSYDAVVTDNLGGSHHVNGVCANGLVGELSLYSGVGFNPGEASIIYGNRTVSHVQIGDGTDESTLLIRGQSDLSVEAAATLTLNGALNGINGLVDLDSNSELRLEGAGWTIDGFAAPRGMTGDGGYENDGGLIATSAGAEVAVPAASWDVEPQLDIGNNRIKLMLAQVAPNSTNGAANWGQFRVRKGSASTAGTVLANFYAHYAAGFANLGYSMCVFAWIKNTSGADVSTKVSLTVDLGAGVSLSVYGGDAPSPTLISFIDFAHVDDQPAIADLAVSV